MFAHVLDMQALPLNGEQENTLILNICFESMKMSDRNVWVLDLTQIPANHACVIPWSTFNLFRQLQPCKTPGLS